MSLEAPAVVKELESVMELWQATKSQDWVPARENVEQYEADFSACRYTNESK